MVGLSPRPLPLEADELNYAAGVLMSIDKWAGINSPIAASTVFSDILPNGQAMGVLKSLRERGEASEAFLSEVSCSSELMADAPRVLSEVKPPRAHRLRFA